LGEFQTRIVDQLAEMRVFVRAIERGTFAGAASDLELSPSAVSKVVRRLEARLGVRLVNRTTRKLSLTAEGETYFHSGRRLIEAVDGLEQEVAASASHPRGLLRINTPVSLGIQHLAPALMEFHRRYPDVRVNVSLTDRIVDFYAEQIDVAVRMGPLSDSGLMSRRIAEIRPVILASPLYVERFGVPKTPADLARHRCIVFTAPGRSRWGFKTTDGGVEYIDMAGTFASDSLQCILQLALQGAGIAKLADFLVAERVRSGELVPLLADWQLEESASVFAVFAPGTQKIPKVRVFVDFLVERFQHQTWRLGNG
jgi:DNA-binding transcriptional LysR family regulator